MRARLPGVITQATAPIFNALPDERAEYETPIVQMALGNPGNSPYASTPTQFN